MPVENEGRRAPRGGRLGCRWLGRLSYPDGLRAQHDARVRVQAGGADELLELEHEPVVTLGRRGGAVDLERLAALGTPVVPTDRGGLATWHGPGQLTAYVVLDLERRRLGVPALVAALGLAMAGVARELGVANAAYDPERPGVYVGGRKLGAIGLHLQRGVSTHGLALNVSCNLEGFLAISPCGMAGLEVTTIARETGQAVDLRDCAERLRVHLDARLGSGEPALLERPEP
jgi:lipoyl(octanoyl) transferase